MRGDIPSYSPDSWAVSVIPKQLLVYLPDAVAPLPEGRGDGARAYEQFFPKSVHVLAEHDLGIGMEHVPAAALHLRRELSRCPAGKAVEKTHPLGRREQQFFHHGGIQC